jgi:hypothetical protein
MGMIVVLAGVALILVFFTTQSVKTASQQASETSDTALLASEAAERLRFLQDMLEHRVEAVLESPQVAALSPEQFEALNRELSRTDSVPLSSEFADLPAPLSLTEAAEFQAVIEYLRSRMFAILARTKDPNIQRNAVNASLNVEGALAGYFQTPTLGNLRELQHGLQGVLDNTSASVPAWQPNQ